MPPPAALRTAPHTAIWAPRFFPADFRDPTNRVLTTAQNNVRHLRDLGKQRLPIKPLKKGEQSQTGYCKP
jgi:hypothetical protein